MRPDPLVLCIDTTAAHCAVAVIQGYQVLAELSEGMSRGQAERLFPMVFEGLAAGKCALEQLDGIAVATGPGNFTGVRIGIAAARGLSVSLSKPAIGVSGLEALAHGRAGTTLALCDGRTGIYSQLFCDGVGAGKPVFGAPDDIEAGQNVDLCIGFGAKEVAARIGAARAQEHAPGVCDYGFAALNRAWASEPRPQPVYVRPADAALPAEAPPQIVP